MFQEISEQFYSLKPKNRDLISLGLIFGTIALGLAGWAWYHGKSYYLLEAGAGIFFIVFSIAWPRGFTPIYKGWMAIAIVLGFFSSRIILFLVYFLIITPIGLTMRLLGKDLLDIRHSDDRRSYWVIREQVKYDPRTSEKMY